MSKHDDNRGDAARGKTKSGDDWWKNGVIYQIYPRSFADDNGDGVGDLPGITAHLNHLEWLGVDGTWLSPFFKSPMKDFGYDVADYCDVDPLFGTLDDYDALVAEAHRLGLKVMVDWVPNHSSDQHAWFQSARQGPESPHRDHYFFRDGKPDGSPPNNWVSVFGGTAWRKNECGQYYLHSYVPEQPDLNWQNPEVERAMLDTLRFWLDRGTDGFRIDVVHRICKHFDLPDNPEGEDLTTFDRQIHRYDESYGDVEGAMAKIRAVLDEYKNRAAIGEVYLFDPKEAGRYVSDAGLHLAFNFTFLWAEFSAQGFGDQIAQAETAFAGRSPVWVLSNHDVSRHATRYQDHDAPESDARNKLLATLLLTLRGTAFVYFGEELGLRDVPIADDQLQDPVSFSLGKMASRDPERTPMAWTANAGADFSTNPDAKPWLPLHADADVRNVKSMWADERTLLWHYKRVIALRKHEAALRYGDFSDLCIEGDVLSFVRTHKDERVALAFNFAAEERDAPKAVLDGEILNRTQKAGRDAQLAGYEARIVKVR